MLRELDQVSRQDHPASPRREDWHFLGDDANTRKVHGMAASNSMDPSITSDMGQPVTAEHLSLPERQLLSLLERRARLLEHGHAIANEIDRLAGDHGAGTSPTLIRARALAADVQAALSELDQKIAVSKRHQQPRLEGGRASRGPGPAAAVQAALGRFLPVKDDLVQALIATGDDDARELAGRLEQVCLELERRLPLFADFPVAHRRHWISTAARFGRRTPTGPEQ